MSNYFPLKRYSQETNHCAVAASASISNFYDNSIDYSLTKRIANDFTDPKQGLNTGEIAILLNKLGFSKITIVSSDLNYLDYSWKKMSRDKLVDELKNYARKTSNINYDDAKSMYNFLSNSPQSNLIISHHFGKYIRSYLSKKLPIIITFNWTMMFEAPKYGDKKSIDTHKGNPEYHAVVAAGFDDFGVYIIDSHTYTSKRFSKGVYKIGWEELMTVMGMGDILCPSDFKKSFLL